jgi:predicted alpha/beta-fold hydrolase
VAPLQPEGGYSAVIVSDDANDDASDEPILVASHGIEGSTHRTEGLLMGLRGLL